MRKSLPTSSDGGWLGYLLPLVKRFRAPLFWALLTMALDAALTVCRPWPLKVVIDRVLPAHPRPSRVPLLGQWLDASDFGTAATLYGACAATLLIAVGTGLFTYAFTRIMGDVGRRCAYDLRRDLFAHMQRLSLRYHDRQATGDLTARLTSDIAAIQDLVVNGTILFVSNSCLLFGMAGLMFWLNWRLALASLSVSPVLFWTVFQYTRRIKAAARRARASEGLLASVAQETLASIRIVQGLAQEEQQNDRFAERNKSSLEATLEGVRYQSRVAPLVDVLAAVGLVVVMGYGARLVRRGDISTGDVVVFFAYVTNLYSPIKALSRLWYSASKASVGAERIAEVLKVEQEVHDTPASRQAKGLKGRIDFRNVGFAYHPGRTILAGVDLALNPGESVALVGPSGAGKSTLVSLIPRLYDPNTGTVLIDGQDIRSFTIQSLRDHVSLVLQDDLLFRGTIRENISFGRPGASDDDILAAAMTANAHEFITQLPEGYDSCVGERGTTLSGGQKQRIAIARAILRDAPILILDEPTTGLDSASEQAVVEALQRAIAGRTTLLISHRKSTLRLAHRTIFLEDGRIISHREAQSPPTMDEARTRPDEALRGYPA